MSKGLKERIFSFFENLIKTNDVVVVDNKGQVLGVVTNVPVSSDGETKKTIRLPLFLKEELSQSLPSIEDIKDIEDMEQSVNDLVFMSFTKEDQLDLVMKMNDQERLEHFVKILENRENFTLHDLHLAGILLKGESVHVRCSGPYLQFGEYIKLKG